MSTIDALLASNSMSAGPAGPAELGARPLRRVAVVTCMDCRIDPLRTLSLQPGEAHILRNAGGVVTEDVIRSLAISQRKLDTREVMLIHHTECGMQTLTDDGFRAELHAEIGVTPPFAIESFADLDEDVRQSIRRVRTSPFVLHRDAVRGFVLDVRTGVLREVEVEA